MWRASAIASSGMSNALATSSSSLSVGMRSPSQPNPLAAALGGELGDRVGLQRPLAVHVPRGIDDHRPIVSRRIATRRSDVDDDAEVGDARSVAPVASTEPLPRLAAASPGDRYISWAIAAGDLRRGEARAAPARPAAEAPIAVARGAVSVTSSKNVLTTLTAGAQASTQLPKLVNHAGPARSSRADADDARQRGREVRAARLQVAGRGDTDGVAEQTTAATRRTGPDRRWRSTSPKLITTMSNGPHDRRHPPDRRTHAGERALAEARQHAGRVDLGVRDRSGGRSR